MSWLDAVRQELNQYREQHDERIVTLHEFYDFSEQRLESRFPNNNNVQAKIRQQLQQLRDKDEVEFLDKPGTYRITIGDKVHQEKKGLERTLDSEPELTEDLGGFTESRRRARDQAFAELVKGAYSQTCAFCGSSRETPVGNPEVEAAHIYPKREDGADDVRNGIALCKLHHWAFDTGWLALSEECEILVKEAPNRDGYYEFKQLEGDSMRLPNEERMAPHRMFLEAHRELNGF
ncbi:MULTISPECIES: HNH endonuclease [Haloferax]|uniref:HNH nuclease domain-containing protein n=1 Tax=Haloferax marinum TaxID=2666143 RepID=A0A6A8G4X2_9EURY|nr:MULTISPECIES: HNH endonuclease [Haloferax]KAB1196624.1 hypothetical protein Hfx1150_03455 [Haloferax sp. CBA1150]MRW95628.1 hypothetical protein [Haloferax marinum]